MRVNRIGIDTGACWTGRLTCLVLAGDASGASSRRGASWQASTPRKAGKAPLDEGDREVTMGSVGAGLSVLVTGGCGYIGSFIVRHLLEAGPSAGGRGQSLLRLSLGGTAGARWSSGDLADRQGCEHCWPSAASLR